MLHIKVNETMAEFNERQWRERGQAELAAIKEREAAVKAAISRSDPEVDIGPFNLAQLGLSVAVVDQEGRIWRVDGTRLRLIWGPNIVAKREARISEEERQYLGK
jgi:hypothetical protein